MAKLLKSAWCQPLENTPPALLVQLEPKRLLSPLAFARLAPGDRADTSEEIHSLKQ